MLCLLVLGMVDPTPLRPRRLGATYSVPTWLPAAAQEVSEPAAVKALGRIRRALVRVETAELSAEIATTFWRTDEYAKAASPKLVFLHGADSNCLEWRYVAEKLGAQGIDCTAVDWWSGGWTDREAIRRRLTDGGPTVEPWTLIRQHLDAFLRGELGSAELGSAELAEEGVEEEDASGEDLEEGPPIVLVGTSLGGAVAIDYAAAHPGRVRALVLIDAGGQSYKAPPPAIVQALAPGVVAAKAAAAWVQSLAQAVRPDEDALIGALHRNEPGWSAAYAAYLASGGYARQVGPPLIRTLRMPTLVIWGEADPILPLSDAFAFECDLPNCVGVERVRHAGHSPHLDDPEVVAAILSRFLEERFDEFDALRGPGGEDQDGVRRREEYREARPPIG